MPRKTSNKRTASPETEKNQMGDMGVDNEVFHTDSLPQTGHDSAIDDGDQVVRSASTRLTLIADTLVKAGLPALARRVKVSARRVAEIGIKEGKTPDFTEKHSTAPLDEPGEDGTAVDDVDEAGKLQFFGFDAPTKDQVGPLKRASRKAAEEAAQPAQPESAPVAPQPKQKQPGNPPIDSMTIKFRRDEPAASGRKADPLPEFKERGEEVLDGLDEDTYEEHEGGFHHAMDELEELEGLAEASVTTGMEYANLAEETTSANAPQPQPAASKQAGVRVDVAPPTWLKQHGFTEEDWHNAVKKCEEKGLLKSGKEFDVVVAVMKRLKKKHAVPASSVASRAASSGAPIASAWKTLKSSLRKVAANGGRWASGEWSTGVEDFGRTLDLNVNTQDESGAPLVASSVTFSLLKEDPNTRVATIEVSDGVVHNETRRVSLNAQQASRYASEWAKASEQTAKNILSGKN